MQKSDDYRDNARRLRVLAHGKPPRIRQELLDISEQYERMADQIDLIAKPLMSWPDEASAPAEAPRGSHSRR
ncbi:MAG TPA: hypothetical protein VGB82_04535 [Alphaproteobacteria bacterium]